MRYLQRSFTLPVSERTSEKQWDLAFLSPEEFKLKYNVNEEDYIRLKNGE